MRMMIGNLIWIMTIFLRQWVTMNLKTVIVMMIGDLVIMLLRR